MTIPNEPVATIVLAGGQGTRLYPLTLHHSKPAVSYGGRYRLIDVPISNSINSNFSKIFVIVQYLPEELHHHISQTYNSVDILTPGEGDHFAGTADAVRKTLPTLLQSPAEYFLILSGDQLYNINFQEMVRFAKESQADLTIASLPVPETDAKRMGLCKISSEQLITEFYEKPQERSILDRFEWGLAPDKKPLYLGSMGIYVFKREALITLLKQDPREDFGHHLIPTAIAGGMKTAAFLYHGYWEDIGTITSYYQANLILTTERAGLDTYDEQQPIYTRPTSLPGPKILCTKVSQSIICEGSRVEAEEISRSIIGMRSRIQRGTIIRDTVLLGNHLKEGSIGENCLIEKAIIDEHVQIGNNVHLTNKEKKQHHDGDGVFIRDGIIIIVSGTQIPDNFVL